MLLQDAAPPQFHGGVQAGLAAERRQQRVGFFLLDDFLDHFGRDRFDVGGVGELGIGHDGRRIGVDQHHLKAFLAQRLAGLGPRIVKLARLADDDRAAADNQNLVDVGSFGHGVGCEP